MTEFLCRACLRACPIENRRIFDVLIGQLEICAECDDSERDEGEGRGGG